MDVLRPDGSTDMGAAFAYWWPSPAASPGSSASVAMHRWQPGGPGTTALNALTVTGSRPMSYPTAPLAPGPA